LRNVTGMPVKEEVVSRPKSALGQVMDSSVKRGVIVLRIARTQGNGREKISKKKEENRKKNAKPKVRMKK